MPVTDDFAFAVDSSWREAFGAPNNLSDSFISPRLFVALRVAIFLGWLGVTVWSVTDHTHNPADESDPHVWIYFTHWTLLLQLAYFGITATLSILANFTAGADGKGRGTPWFARLAYATQSVCYVSSFFVCMLYWTVLYDGSINTLFLTEHSLSFGVTLLDFLIAGLPMRLAQVCT